MSSPDLPFSSANPPNRPRTSPITLTAPDNVGSVNQTLPAHEEHRGRRDTSIQSKPANPPDTTRISKTLRERGIEERDLEDPQKMHEQRGDDIEEDEIPEPSSTPPTKTISERWREQQRLLEAKHQQTQTKSSSATSARNISTSSTSSGYTANLPTIYDSLQTTTPGPKTDTENYILPSIVMEWVEQELTELRLGTYSPAAAAEMDEHDNEIDDEGLPIDPSARHQALEKMKLKLQRRREQEKSREDEQQEGDEDEDKDEEEEEEEEEEDSSLTFAAFDRKLRMKAAVWEIQRREKRSSDSKTDQHTEPGSTELRFGPPKAGMQAVMEERARRKRDSVTAKEALEEVEIEEKTFNTSTALSIKDPDPIRGMQVVMEERARRRRAKAGAEESSTAHNKQSHSGSPKS